MLKKGNRGKEVREHQEKLLSLGYDLPKYGADGDFGSETESAVSEFKQELIELAEQDGVSSELQKLIDALVAGEWKRPRVLPEITAEEIEELVTSIYDAFHPLVVRSEETAVLSTSRSVHVESLQTALKRLGFYHGKIDGIYGNGTRRSVCAAQYEMELSASGEVDEETASAITDLLRQAESGERWKLPRKSDQEVEVPEDQAELYRSIMKDCVIPPYFAEALAEQVADCPPGGTRRDGRRLRLVQSETTRREVGNITNRELRCSAAKNIKAGAHLLSPSLRLVQSETVVCFLVQSAFTRRTCLRATHRQAMIDTTSVRNGAIEAIETVQRDWTKTRFHK